MADDQANNNQNNNFNQNNLMSLRRTYVDDDRHTQEAYKRNKGRLIEDNPYSDLEEFPDESSLFIGDLSRTVTEDMLLKFFSQCGPVEGVDIKRDKVTKNNLGYGFVKFKDRHQAERAKHKMNGQEIGGRAIRIGWAQKNTNLFVCLVGDLEEKITGEHLRQIFKEFGPIYEEDTFVKRNKYGFVKFKHRAHAEKAKAALDGKHLVLKDGYKTGKPVRIGWGDANTQRNCVHVQFEQNSASSVDLKEEDFKQQFQKYGTVNKVSLPRYSDKRLKGYGFIHFEENDDGEESAAKAITELTASQIKGVVIMCNFGKRQNQRHKRFAQKKQNNEMGDGMHGGYGGGYGHDGNDGYGGNTNNGMNNNYGNDMNNNFGGNNNFGNNDMNNNQFGNNQFNNDMNNNMNQMNNNQQFNMINNGMMNNPNMAPNQDMNQMGGMNMNQMNINQGGMNIPQGMNQMDINNPNMGGPQGMNMNNNPMMNNPMGPGGGNMNIPQGMNMNNPMMQNMGGNPMINNNGMGAGGPGPMGMPPAPGMPGGPPLSGPNPFGTLPPNMMGNPMMNPNMPNPMIPNQGGPGPQITVNMMNPNGLPPSPPPPNNLPLPPNPNNFKLNLQNVPNPNQTQGGPTNDEQNRNNNQQNGNTQGGDNQQRQQGGPQINDNKGNQFQIPPFNAGALPSFPAPQAAPQLNMANNGPSAPGTPSKPGQPGPMGMPGNMPLFNPLGGNPMFNALGGLPPQLSPQLGPNPIDGNKTGGSNSPQMNASPPNLFVPPYAPQMQPPPPGNMAGIKPPFMPTGPHGIPSPPLAQLPLGLPGQRRGPNQNSPSPPVSPILNQPIPFIPSPQLLQQGNPNMPPMTLNNPLGNNPMLKNAGLAQQFGKMNLGGNQIQGGGIHNPLIMQKGPNPMLNQGQGPPQPQGQGPPQNQQNQQLNNQGGNR